MFAELFRSNLLVQTFPVSESDIFSFRSLRKVRIELLEILEIEKKTALVGLKLGITHLFGRKRLACLNEISH